jgi:hypothetical protein
VSGQAKDATGKLGKGVLVFSGWGRRSLESLAIPASCRGVGAKRPAPSKITRVREGLSKCWNRGRRGTGNFPRSKPPGRAGQNGAVEVVVFPTFEPEGGVIGTQ